MATDGTNIIDGDLAIELYADFIHQYNQGVNIEAMLQEYEDSKVEYGFDAFSYEIYITTMALAFWEIGELTPNVKKDAEDVVRLNACAKSWTDEVGEEAGKDREKVLAQFLEKIGTPNPKVKKRKKPKKPKILQLFDSGDLLILQYPDQSWGTSIIADIGDEYANFVISYSFIVIDYRFNGSFNLEDFLHKAKIYVSHIPTGQEDGGIEPMPSVFYREVFDEGDGKFLSCFQKIGTVNLQLGVGQSHLANTFADFCDDSPIQSSIKYAQSLGEQILIPTIAEYLNEVKVI